MKDNTLAKVRDVLIAARDLLLNEENWLKGSGCQDKNGVILFNPKSDEACKWCSLGAIYKFTNDDNIRVIAIDYLIKSLPTGFSFVSSFNDKSTHNEVIAFYNDAIKYVDQDLLKGVKIHERT